MQTRHSCRAVVAALLALPFTPALAQNPEIPRGQLLYENHCMNCHSPQIHQRSNRVAKSYADIRSQIIRWQGEQKLGWTHAEVDQVQDYLNQSFYRFDAGHP